MSRFASEETDKSMQNGQNMPNMWEVLFGSNPAYRDYYPYKGHIIAYRSDGSPVRFPDRPGITDKTPYLLSIDGKREIWWATAMHRAIFECGLKHPNAKIIGTVGYTNELLKMGWI